MKSESPSCKSQTASRLDDLFIGIGHLLACKAARVVVATCFAIISSVAITSAETVVLYGNIPDPIVKMATRGVTADMFPSDENRHDLSAQPFFTGELGIVSSISFPIAVNGSPTGVVHYEIWDDNSGDPGKKIASVGDLDLDSWIGDDFEYQLVTFDRPVTGLEPNTKYHLWRANRDTDVSGFSHTYFSRATASAEGTNNAGRFQFPQGGSWNPRGHAENKLVVEILEISPPPIDEFTLTIPQSDGGTVVASPEMETYDEGTTVTLTATPDEGYAFAGWEGDTNEEGTPLTITLTMDSDKSIGAKFVTAVAETVVLYGNIPDPIVKMATRGVTADMFPSDENRHDLSAQPFFTGELGIVSSISFPIAVNGSPTGVVHYEIWDDNSGDPGKKIASVGDLDLDSWIGDDFEYQLVTFDRPVTGLEPNTKYHLWRANRDTDVSGFSHTYFSRMTASDEGTNDAGKLQFPQGGSWSPRGHVENKLVMEILEIAPSPNDEFTFTIQQSDRGTVTKNPELPSYPSGMEVTLTATPSDGYEFTKWLIGEIEWIDNPLALTIEADTTVTPEFAKIPATFTLTVPAIAGGTVVASPELETYQEGTTVTLTATPNEGYAFAGWEGDTNEEGNPLTITLVMDSDKSVAATFRSVIIPEIAGVVFDPIARSVSLTWPSHPDAIYEIQGSADLVRWEVLETKQGTGEQTTAELDSAPNGERQRFYRLREKL